MTSVKLVAVFVENKPAQTARVTKLLADAGIDIRWVTIASSGSFGVMKFLVREPERALAALKQEGLMAAPLDVLPVEIEDRPGALYQVAQCLADAGINLDNTSGMVTAGRAVVVIETHQIERATGVLVQHGLKLLTREQMLAL